MQTPDRFRTKRQFGAYCGLALETRSSADYRFVGRQLVRSRKPVFVRGPNRNHNHELKNLFKGAATTASARERPLRDLDPEDVHAAVRPIAPGTVTDRDQQPEQDVQREQ